MKLILINNLLCFFIIGIPNVSLYAENRIALSDIINSDIIIGNNNTISKNISPPDGEVEISAGLANFTDQENKEYEINPYATMRYKEIITDSEIKILPIFDNNNYFENYIADKEISTLYDFHNSMGISTTVPFIETKILNNSSKSITIDKIIFDVESSTSYKKPFVLFSEPINDFARINLYDEGSIEAKNIELNFNLFPFNNLQDTDDYKYTIKTKFIHKHANLDFFDSLTKEGVDSNFLLRSYGYNDSRNSEKSTPLYVYQSPEKFINPLNKYTNTKICDETNKEETLRDYIDKKTKCDSGQMVAYVVGEYKIEGKYNDKKIFKRGKLRTSINLTPFIGLGDSLPTIRVADIILKNDGQNYPISVNINRLIKPYDVEKYVFSFDSYKIGHHIFNIKVKFSNGEKLIRKKISMYIYKPEIGISGLAGKSTIFMVNAKPSLRVRSSPSINKDNVIGKLQNGDNVRVFKKVGNLKSLMGKKGHWVMIEFMPKNSYGSVPAYVFNSYLTEIIK